VRRFLVGQLLFLPSLVLAQEGSPAGPVPPALLQARRAALMERMGEGVAILRAASERSNDPPDSDYPQDSDFRQDNDFFYLTGLEVPNALLVLLAHETGPDEVRLFLPPRNTGREQWLGPRLGPGAEAAEQAGLPASAVRSLADFEPVMDSLVTLPDGRPPRLFIKRTRSVAPNLPAGRWGSASGPVDLNPHLGALRLVKDSSEVARLRRAVEISLEGHLAAMRVARPGAWEYELEAAAEYEFRRLGAERVGYPSIVGAGVNGTILHYDESRARLEEGQLVVMDMGAEFGYYTADITRTIPVSGRFTERQRAIYNLALEAQQAAIDAVRPGVTMAQLNEIARRTMRERSGDLCGRQTCDAYFIHGLGHWIGMDVHDVGGYSRPLAPGMVLTIEPGIYLPEEKLGVRIEDNLLVTPDGHELLSARLPRTAADIERYMETARGRSP
jgi:Xaa-Pro aminopeptidase